MGRNLEHQDRCRPTDLNAPTFGAATLAGYCWLTVYCPGCGTVKENRSRQDRSPPRCLDHQSHPRPLLPDVPASCTLAQLRRLTRDWLLEKPPDTKRGCIFGTPVWRAALNRGH